MFNNIKVGARLAAGFGLTITIFIILTFFSVSKMDKLAEMTHKMYRHPFAVSNAVLRVKVDLVSMHRSMKDVALARNSLSIDAAVSKVNEYEQNVYKDFEIIRERFLGNKSMYEKVFSLFKAWKPIRDEVIQLMRSGNRIAAANITKGKGAAHLASLNTSVEALNKFAQNKAIDFDNNVSNVHSNTILITYGALIFGCIVGVFISMFITRTITTPLEKAAMYARKLAGGDLTLRIETDAKDEIGNLLLALHDTIANLSGMIQVIKDSAISLSEASQDISASTEELSATAEEQGNHSNTVASSVQELAASSSDISSSISETRESASESSNMTKEGSKSIQKSIESFNLIKSQTDNLSVIIKNLGDSTLKIGNIIDVINDVADQTNLLALNAAIEAARAGEAGRGFAVVADEVRKLAERTGAATKEITGIITSLQTEADKAESAMKDASREVEHGGELGRESLTMLEKIVDSSNEIVDSTNMVAHSISEENATIEEVNNSIHGIATSAEESAEAIQSVAVTAERLSDESDKLMNAINQFRIK